MRDRTVSANSERATPTRADGGWVTPTRTERRGTPTRANGGWATPRTERRGTPTRANGGWATPTRTDSGWVTPTRTERRGTPTRANGGWATPTRTNSGWAPTRTERAGSSAGHRATARHGANQPTHLSKLVWPPLDSDYVYTQLLASYWTDGLLPCYGTPTDDFRQLLAA